MEISTGGTIFGFRFEKYDKMRIKTEVIERIREKQDIRLKLALALNKSENQVRRYIDENSDNLTKASALKVLRDETGLADDQILESNPLVLNDQQNGF